MRNRALAAIVVISVLLAGCELPNGYIIGGPATEPEETIPDPSSMVIDQTPEKMQKRFDPTLQGGDDSEQNDVEWARRYEELSIGNNALRETNHELALENKQLEQQMNSLKSELEQTHKDLAEANEFLAQMHLELNKWKTDVLGFRQENRQAQQVQMEALGKILRILGAEPMDTSNDSEAGSFDARESK
ncbi:MAG: hypothetical protein ACYTFX_03345 [Planctomycetota bacterium]|jgi:chromosome segregation ATPase